MKKIVFFMILTASTFITFSCKKSELVPDYKKENFVVYTNPGDSRLALITRNDGRKVVYLGEKDNNGLTQSITQMIVYAADYDPLKTANIWFDEKRRPTKVLHGDGSRVDFDWISDTSCFYTIVSADGSIFETKALNISGIPQTGFFSAQFQEARFNSQEKIESEVDYAKGQVQLKCGEEYLRGATIKGWCEYRDTSNEAFSIISEVNFKEISPGIFEYKIPIQKNDYTNFQSICESIDQVISLTCDWVNPIVLGISCGIGRFINPELIPICMASLAVAEICGMNTLPSEIVAHPTIPCDQMIALDKYFSGNFVLDFEVVMQGCTKEYNYDVIRSTPTIEAIGIDLSDDTCICSKNDFRGDWFDFDLLGNDNPYDCTSMNPTDPNSGYRMTFVGTRNSGTILCPDKCPGGGFLGTYVANGNSILIKTECYQGLVGVDGTCYYMSFIQNWIGKKCTINPYIMGTYSGFCVSTGWTEFPEISTYEGRFWLKKL